MPCWRDFWQDEIGAVVSAELIAVSTVTVLGGTVGMSMLGSSVDSELQESAFAIRSFNQSYKVGGHFSPRAWTAGSAYTQPDVDKSLSELDAMVGDQPKAKSEKPSKKGKKRAKEKEQSRDEMTFLQGDEAALREPDPVEAADDASQMEAVIESAPEA